MRRISIKWKSARISNIQLSSSKPVHSFEQTVFNEQSHWVKWIPLELRVEAASVTGSGPQRMLQSLGLMLPIIVVLPLSIFGAVFQTAVFSPIVLAIVPVQIVWVWFWFNRGYLMVFDNGSIWAISRGLPMKIIDPQIEVTFSENSKLVWSSGIAINYVPLFYSTGHQSLKDAKQTTLDRTQNLADQFSDGRYDIITVKAVTIKSVFNYFFYSLKRFLSRTRWSKVETSQSGK